LDEFSGDVQSSWGEPTFELAGINMAAVFLSSDVDFVSTVDRTHIRVDICHHRLLIVRETEASCNPVNAVETYVEGKGIVDEEIWWRLADKSHRGVEVCSYNLFTESAVRYDPIFRQISEIFSDH
jgi:hypothetical protein